MVLLTHVIMASLDSWLLHTEETNNTGDETESDESEPQPRQAKSMLCYYFKEKPTIKISRSIPS